MTTTDESLSQSDDNQKNESIISSPSLQIVFINETAMYYHISLSPKLVLKSGISAVWNYDEKMDGEGNYQYQYSSSSITEQKMKANGINSNFEIALSSQLMYSLNDFEYAKVYIGGGASFLYALTKNSNNSSVYTDSTYSKNGYESNRKTIGVGPSVSLLIKSKLYGSVYLMSEYNLTAYYTRNTEDNNSRYESKYSDLSAASVSYHKDHTQSNGWKVRFSNVRVGLLILL
jgi:hypothetical protein